jgi:hypothetical protein
MGGSKGRPEVTLELGSESMNIDLARLRRKFEKELDKLEERRTVLTDNIKQIDAVLQLAQEAPDDIEEEDSDDSKPASEAAAKKPVEISSKKPVEVAAENPEEGEKDSENDSEKEDSEKEAAGKKAPSGDEDIQIEWVPPGPQWQRRAL